MIAPSAADIPQSLAAEILKSSGILRLGVSGSSMLPTLWPGDVVTLVAIAEQPTVGQIVLFQRCGQFVVHRVVEAGSSGGQLQVTTRGDSMIDQDGPIAASEVLGRVVAIRRGQIEFSVPKEQSPFNKAFGWWLSRSDFVSRVALRWHAARQTRLAFAPTISEGIR